TAGTLPARRARREAPLPNSVRGSAAIRTSDTTKLLRVQPRSTGNTTPVIRTAPTQSGKSGGVTLVGDATTLGASRARRAVAAPRARERPSPTRVRRAGHDPDGPRPGPGTLGKVYWLRRRLRTRSTSGTATKWGPSGRGDGP